MILLVGLFDTEAGNLELQLVLLRLGELLELAEGLAQALVVLLEVDDHGIQPGDFLGG